MPLIKIKWFCYHIICIVGIHIKMVFILKQDLESLPWASCQIRKIAGCACVGIAGNVFPHRQLLKKTLVSDPCMHHGTCVRHVVPWCMSGSLNSSGGGNVPGIPGTCTTYNFTYLARGPWQCIYPSLSVSETIQVVLSEMFVQLLCWNLFLLWHHVARPFTPSHFNWGPFYWHELTVIPAWISNHIHYKVWDGITYPFLNFNGAIVEV